MQKQNFVTQKKKGKLTPENFDPNLENKKLSKSFIKIINKPFCFKTLNKFIKSIYILKYYLKTCL